MKYTALLLFSLALICLVICTPKAQEQPAFQVITNAENPVTSLSKTQVSKILLKKVTKWDDGQPVEAVDQAGSEEVRKIFTKAIHGRSVTAIKRYWQGEIFKGRGVPPPELATEVEVVKYVRDRRGAIGYVSRDAPLDGVKVLLITE